MNVSGLPPVNAALNASSAIFLTAGYIFIHRRNIVAHATCMIGALVTSAAFLTCYLIYHAIAGERTSGLPHSALRTAYLIMLASHVLLAVLMLPPIIAVVWLAYRRNFITHRRIARPTFWVWLYVSVTGVIIYWLLYHVFPALR